MDYYRTGKYVVPLSRNPHDLLVQWLSGAGLDEEWEAGLNSSAGRAKEAVKAIVTGRLTLTGWLFSSHWPQLTVAVSSSTTPLDKISIASSSGLISSLIPRSSSIDAFNSSTPLKLGAAPITEKLREQVIRTIRDEESGVNGDASPLRSASTLPNGHGNGHDVNMTPEPTEIKLDPEIDGDSDLISPEESETNPPVPAVFRIADLKREVEAVRDKRKVMRLGPGAEEGKVGSISSVLPSVVAFTVFDGGEG